MKKSRHGTRRRSVINHQKISILHRQAVKRLLRPANDIPSMGPWVFARVLKADHWSWETHRPYDNTRSRTHMTEWWPANSNSKKGWPLNLGGISFDLWDSCPTESSRKIERENPCQDILEEPFMEIFDRAPI
jgi:hypothetical protein